MQVLSPWQSGGATHKAQLLMARCCPPPPLLHLYCLLGSTGAINVGSLPSCSWHFYLLSHKALESNESRAEEPLAQRRGGEEMGSSGCISAELALLRPSLPAHCWGKQDSEALASDNCREHPRPSLVSLSELWRPGLFCYQGNQSSLERKSTRVLWMLRCSPSLGSPPPK